jgi:hypothetical protein
MEPETKNEYEYVCERQQQFTVMLCLKRDLNSET